MSINPISHASAPASDDALMGAQLTEQYHRATGGMREVLRFGAMMMALREKLSALGQLSPGGGGRGAKDGIADWLRTHAAEINKSTAYRFLHVTESVAAEFQLPAKVSFIDLATKPADELPETLQKKQLELWDFVSGTSQRSWLDRFNPHSGLRGGKREKAGPVESPEEKEARELAARRENFACRIAGIAHATEDQDWRIVEDIEVERAIDTLEAFISGAREWLRTPKSKRAAIAIGYASQPVA